MKISGLTITTYIVRHAWYVPYPQLSILNSVHLNKAIDIYWYFSLRPLIKSSDFKMYKMYCQQIFLFVQLPYRFLLLTLQCYVEALPSSMQSTFSKHSSNPSSLLSS